MIGTTELIAVGVLFAAFVVSTLAVGVFIRLTRRDD